MARAPNKIEIEYSRPLEEYWDIDFTCVGSPEWLEGSFVPGVLERVSSIAIRDPERDLKPILDWLMRQLILGCDSETTGADKRLGLDPWREGSRLLLLQLGSEDRVYLIEPALVPYFRPVLECAEILHLFQNGVYDWKWLFSKCDIHTNRIYDTMIAEQLLTAGLYGYGVGLADIVRRYPPYRFISKQQRKQFVLFEQNGGKFTWEMLYYAARDVVLLFPVMRAQLERIRANKMERVAALEFRLIPCMAIMEIGGVYLNQRKHRYAIDHWRRRQAWIEAEVLKLYNTELVAKRTVDALFPGEGYSFKIRSNAQKLAVMLELGHAIKDARRETLEAIDHPMAKLLVEYSEVFKITSTYGEAMLERVNPRTGRLHPRWNQLGAGDSNDSNENQTKNTIATGRIAGDFMQLPKDSLLFEPVTDPQELAMVRERFHQEIADVQRQTSLSHHQDPTRVVPA